MATTTSHVHNGGRSWLRFRSRKAGWIMPESGRPKSLITHKYSPGLADDALYMLARGMLAVDCTVIYHMQDIYNAIDGIPSESAVCLEAPTLQAEACQGLADIETILQQIRDIVDGRCYFGASYLKDRHLLSYWQKVLAISDKVQKKGKDDPWWEQTNSFLWELARRASKLPDLIVTAAEEGFLELESENRLTVQERWMRLDGVKGLRFKAPGSLPTWSEVVLRLPYKAKILEPKADTIQSFATEVKVQSTALWWLFFITTLSNVFTFTLAYRYSIHKPGFVKDMDFWLLVQGCITQTYSIITLCLPLWRRSQSPRSFWISPIAVVAIICTVLAIPIYLIAPMEWSAFLVLVAAAIQAFLIVQLTIADE